MLNFSFEFILVFDCLLVGSSGFEYRFFLKLNFSHCFFFDSICLTF